MATLGFEVEWFDNVSNSCKRLYLKYYLSDNTIELLHYEKNACFLGRIHYPSVTLSSLFIGNSITVYSRLLTIKAYANSATEEYMMSHEIHVLCTVNREDGHLLGDLFKTARSQNLRTGRVSSTSQSISVAGLNIIPDDFIIEVVANCSENAEKFISKAQDISGAITAITLEANLIKQIIYSAIPISVPDNCTLCIIKPHVVAANRHEEVLRAIINHGGFAIAGIMMTHLHSDMADEFLRVYRKIIPMYSSLLEQMSSGPLMALMITRNNYDSSDLPIVSEFREFCGPMNCELAALIRPNSIRAKLGNPGVKTNIIQNGVHCTDLSDDGFMECSYFFKTIHSIKQLD